MRPSVYVVAGPNGAGKTTFAREFLPSYADCRNFVNADLIAGGISPFSPESAAFRAGRMLVDEIDRLATRNADFGFESTLSGKTHLRLIRRLKSQGYGIHIFFLWPMRLEVSLSRIKERVIHGGHDEPMWWCAAGSTGASEIFSFLTGRWLTPGFSLTIPGRRRR